MLREYGAVFPPRTWDILNPCHHQLCFANVQNAHHI
jgi:hypothetical protein